MFYLCLPEIILPLMQLNGIAVSLFLSVSTWGSGVDIILDCVGGSYWEKNLSCLRTDGRWVIYGLLSGGEVHGDLLARLLSKRGSIHTSLLRSRDKEASNDYQRCIQFNLKICDSFESFLLIPALKQKKRVPPWIVITYFRKHCKIMLLSLFFLYEVHPFSNYCITGMHWEHLGLFNILTEYHNWKICSKK